MQAAIARWVGAGISPAETAELRSVPVELANLGGAFLGLEGDDTILIDTSADGYGWFIDPTPASDGEFARTSDPQEEIVPAGSPAYGRMDLLTVVMHELGHVLGLADVPNGEGPDTLMSEELPTGVRRLPGGAGTDDVVGHTLAAKDVVFHELGARAAGGNMDSLADFASLDVILEQKRKDRSLVDLRGERGL